MSILEKANELGKLLKESEELKKYKESEIKYLNNEELQQEINDYKQLYSTYLKSLDEKLESDINLKYEKLMSVSDFSEYMQNKSKFEKLHSTVHSLIDYYVGSESKSSCDSCKGCSKKA